MTLISHRRKFIFVHAHKTAGTSLQISLSRWLGKDDVVSITSHNRKVGETVWASCFKFTVARNPWLVSLLYFRRSSRYWRDVWTGRKRSLRDAVGNLPRAFRTLQRIPWFYFSRGEACMDYVIRFENLQQGCDEACPRLGLPLQSLPSTHSRLRPAGDGYRDYYTDFSREYVADLRRPMIAAFGYRFDDGR